MKASYTAAASRDVYELARFYAGIDRRLGIRVLNQLSELQSTLVANPRLGFKVSDDSRRILLHSFPYAVYYLVDDVEDTVWILGVMHQSSHPSAWRDRIQEKPATYALAA
jgi:plasmid stabilization system protein ParE